MSNFYKFRCVLKTLFICIPFILCSCNNSSTSTNGHNAEVAARVNSTTIPLTRVDRQIEQGLKQQKLTLADLTPIELASARMQVLDQLITQEILLQRAQKESIQVSEEDINQEIQVFISSQGWTQEEFQKQLTEAGLKEDEFRTEQRQGLLIRKLQERQKSKIPAPSEKEITDYYNKNKEQFKIGRGVYLSQVVVDPQNNGLKNDAIGEEQTKQKVSTISTRLKSGDDFATVARVVSEDMQTSQRGGDLGFITEEDAIKIYPESLIKRFFSMREGEITEPISGSQGRFYIFKVTGKKMEAEELKLEDPEVKKRIADGIRGQREQVLNGALLFAATSDTKVENYLAQRILENPGNFGSARPANIASTTPEASQNKK